MARTVLLAVEGDRELREKIARALSDDGYSVLEAKNAREALIVLSLIRPNLLLLDMLMPLMSVWVLEALRDTPQLRSLPVVLISAQIDKAPQRVARLLRKPIDLAALLNAVRQHCD